MGGYTLVTASWKCSSEICCGVLLEKRNIRLMGGCEPVRSAIMSIFRLVLLTVASCFSGAAGGASGGSAEEKFHSSSSAAGAAAGAGAAGFEDREASAAKGSLAAWFCGGGENADFEVGCGVPDCEVGAEVKEEKLEKEAGGGVAVGIWPLAVLLWVTEESNAGPGISGDINE